MYPAESSIAASGGLSFVCARTNTETAVPLPCCSEQLAAGGNGLILLVSVRSTQQHGFSQKNKREL
jgi:hypothetical protein